MVCESDLEVRVHWTQIHNHTCACCVQAYSGTAQVVAATAKQSESLSLMAVRRRQPRVSAVDRLVAQGACQEVCFGESTAVDDGYTHVIKIHCLWPSTSRRRDRQKRLRSGRPRSCCGRPPSTETDAPRLLKRDALRLGWAIRSPCRNHYRRQCCSWPTSDMSRSEHALDITFVCAFRAVAMALLVSFSISRLVLSTGREGGRTCNKL